MFGRLAAHRFVSTQATHLKRGVEDSFAETPTVFDLSGVAKVEGEFPRGTPKAFDMDLWVAEYFVASDAAAIIEHTNRVLYLEDDDVASIEDGGRSTILQTFFQFSQSTASSGAVICIERCRA